MKKLLIALTAGLAGTLLVAATPSAAAPSPQTLEVYVTEGTPTLVDELEPGLGPGDWLLFHDAVVDADGAEIGTAVTRVQVIEATDDGDVAFILDCTVELDNGRLVFTGAERFSHLESATSYALVGGTGGYAGVEGQVTGEPAEVDGQPTSKLTFNLVKK